MELLKYILGIKEQVFFLLCEHIFLSSLAIILSIVIGIPLGILITYFTKTKKVILGIINVIQSIPSMALLGFTIPFLGIGKLPAIIMVVLYSLLPIVKNTYTGIEGISPFILESAEGIGMTRYQILKKIQIPLALPVIMSGVRISVVTAIGLMTIAAFIGAGGLGYLVFSGIRTINNYQILAGAIPACILALFMDWFTGVFEKAVIPLGIQINGQKHSIFFNKKIKKIILICSSIFIGFMIIFSGAVSIKPVKSEKVIVLGSKEFTEGEVLSNIVADMIEAETDIKVVRKFSLGGTQICFTALKTGEIDGYIDYTGTIYGDTLGYPPIQDMEEVYNTVKKDMYDKYNIDVLNQLGFNNTYAIALKKETSEKYNLKKISDLEKYSNRFKLSASLEFLNRKDCLVGLREKYDLKFKDIIGIDGSNKYLAVLNGESDMTDVYTTDALLTKLNFVVLEDDRNFFPPYYAVPLIRKEITEKYPEIIPIFERLEKYLNNEVVSELNYQVENMRKKPEDVAKEFIKNNNLINKIGEKDDRIY